MAHPLAYLDGRLIPADQASVPVTDAGFVQGVTVAEQMRTFGGRIFRLEPHLARLARSLETVGVEPPIAFDELIRNAEELVAHNRRLLDEGDDLGLSLFVTPGTYPAFAVHGNESRPLIGMHTYPLPFHLWADKYERGQSLVVTDVRQVPTDCWPAELKCRSRMHYYLADRKAREMSPGARALLLDEQGDVVELSTANLVAYFPGEGLVSPPRERILPGISMSMVAELAQELSLRFSHRRLKPDDLRTADEVILCSTSPCLLPVVELDGAAIGAGRPGPSFRKLLDAWSRAVGVDIAEQATRFAKR